MKRLVYSLSLLLLAATVILSVSSCSKKGDAGPAGQQGQKGDKGDNGAGGPTGPKGDTGTVNVIYSDWLDVAYKPDTVHRAGGKIDTIGYYANITAPKLTTDILTKGELKVYINLSTAADPVITPLPYTDLRSGLFIKYIAFKQGIQFDSNGDISTVQNNTGAKLKQYRYILIPGGTTARKSDAVDWNNYQAVKAYLGLKD